MSFCLFLSNSVEPLLIDFVNYVSSLQSTQTPIKTPKKSNQLRVFFDILVYLSIFLSFSCWLLLSLSVSYSIPSLITKLILSTLSASPLFRYYLQLQGKADKGNFSFLSETSSPDMIKEVQLFTLRKGKNFLVMNTDPDHSDSSETSGYRKSPCRSSSSYPFSSSTSQSAPSFSSCRLRPSSVGRATSVPLP